MSKRSSETKSAIAGESGEVSPVSRRDFVIKVRVNAAEKLEMDRQKGRLSFSEFLRDRGLCQGKVYDPTYAAIGSIYQSARNLRESGASIEEARILVRNSAATLTGLIGQVGSADRALDVGRDLVEIAGRLHAQAAQLERKANALGEQARKLAEQHMKEMLKRYPATALEPRKRR